MPYCAYLRKSRADMDAESRGEGETLARHKTILEALAAHNNHHIDEWYPEVVSGETIAARPQMQRLLADVGAGRWDGIYVMEVERLARGDTSDQGLVAQTFKYSNTRIITPAKTYDAANEMDENFFEFALFMSRFEYKTINRRIRAGLLQSVHEGKYVSARPAYGYRKVKLSGEKGFTLAIHEEEAQTVRMMFDWYINGRDGVTMGFDRIARTLLDLHISTGEQGEVWRAYRVKRIITNEVYIGKIRWGNTQTHRALENGVIKKRIVKHDDYKLIDGRHPAIIADDIFYAAQAVLKSKTNIPVRYGQELSNPLSGILFCARCGYAIRGNPPTSRQPAALKCTTPHCPTVNVYRHLVESRILDVLRGILEEYEVHESDPRKVNENPSFSPEDAALQRILEEQKTLQAQKDKLHDLLEQEVYTPEVFAERNTVITRKLLELEKSRKDLQGKLKKAKRDPSQLVPEIRHVLDTYEFAQTAREKNMLLKAVISRIDYEKIAPTKKRIPMDAFTLQVYLKLSDSIL